MKSGEIWQSMLDLFKKLRGFVPTRTPAGTPNLDRVLPRIWRSGQPPSLAAWIELEGVVAPQDEAVTIIKLNFESEGSDSGARAIQWAVEDCAMDPRGDEPWTVVVKPDRGIVEKAIGCVIDAWHRGRIVVVHCTHGRDRTSLCCAILKMRLLNWTKEQAIEDMLQHGYRWELLGLDEYLVTV